MTPPKKRKLQLVPYEPDNYTPGEVLALDEATVVKSDKAIGSALSLYFQWEKKRSCHITFSEGPAQLCEMDYDHDEASPTEIRMRLVKTSKKKVFKVVPGSTVVVRFEIFRVTYVFTSTVTAVSADPKVEGWHSIIEVPNELRVLRSRHLPRLELDDAGRARLPKASFSAPSGTTLDLKLLEIGMGSVRASFSGDSVAVKGKSGNLVFGEASVAVEVVRHAAGEIILKLNFADYQDFGLFWDYYRLVAYPSMRSRYEVPLEEGIELYEKTNYFGTFAAAKLADEEKKKIIDTWIEIKKGNHKTIADYYITDAERYPCGSSGLALTNFSGKGAVWTFHQLCAIKNPSLIEQSGALYIWRAEYLSARPEGLAAAVSFRSKSRWLERIYVKHASSGKTETKLVAVTQRRCTVLKNIKNSSYEIKKYPVGSLERFSTTTPDLWGAANPKYLNASANLDMIVSLSRRVELGELQDIGGSFVAKLGLDSMSLVYVFPHDSDIPEMGGVIGPSDRYCVFSKADLIPFMSAVDHSIAVTERKLLHAGVV